ncbi:MAG TPA: DUF2249 domain-containing protein [Candidatus Dormibacteraeota bacterium]|nr:DUF2249 domain-containing protein [Candidatus Dormibacteraeota bacterium]
MNEIRLDNRGLHPPEPMIRILTALDAMTGPGVLTALLDREPRFLFPELEARGLTYTCVREEVGYALRVERGA